MKAVWTLLVLAVICGGIFALGRLRRTDDGKPILNVADDVALTVNVATPEREKITRLVQAPGDVEAVDEVEISAEIVSKIVEMAVEEGDEVSAGDLLCRLDDSNLLADAESAAARIARLEASVVQAEVDVEKAERDYKRQLELVESNATSDLEMRDYRTRYRKAVAVHEMHTHELAEAQAFAKRIGEDLKKTVITAPIGGVVSKLNAEQGEVVVTGTMNNPGTVIMSISDLSRMQVRARIDEMDVPYVRADQPGRVYLQSEPDKPVPAKVVRVASKGTKTVGRDVVTFEALLEVLETEARVKPGMTANVEVEVDERDDAITVPVEAVVHRLRKDLPEEIVKAFDEKQAGLELSERVKRGQYIKVLFVKDGDVAKVRLIDSGIADTRRVEICDGIELEDTIIVGPYRSLDQLEDGKKIALAPEDKKSSKQGEQSETDQKVARGDDESSNGAAAHKDKGDTDKPEADDADEAEAVTASATP